MKYIFGTMKNNISEYDVKKLGTKWKEYNGDGWKEATVTISWRFLEKKRAFF